MTNPMKIPTECVGDGKQCFPCHNCHPRHFPPCPDGPQPSSAPQARAEREASSSPSPEGEELLAADSLAICQQRGWSLHWAHRGAHLHLEASELIEAVRGKRSDPTKEAGDVLLVLMSLTQANGIPWRDVVAAARAKVEEFKTKPRYAGEEYDPALATGGR